MQRLHSKKRTIPRPAAAPTSRRAATTDAPPSFPAGGGASCGGRRAPGQAALVPAPVRRAGVVGCGGCGAAAGQGCGQGMVLFLLFNRCMF